MFEAQLAKVESYLKDHDCFHCLPVQYNDVLRDPRPTVEALNDFLGGDLDTQRMLAVVDPSLYRNRM